MSDNCGRGGRLHAFWPFDTRTQAEFEYGCEEAAKNLNSIQKVAYFLPRGGGGEWSWFAYVSCTAKHWDVFNVYVRPSPSSRLFQCWVLPVYKWKTSFPALQLFLQRQKSSHFKQAVRNMAHRALLNTEWQLAWPLVTWKWLWQISFVCTFLRAESEDSSEAQANFWVVK